MTGVGVGVGGTGVGVGGTGVGVGGTGVGVGAAGCGLLLLPPEGTWPLTNGCCVAGGWAVSPVVAEADGEDVSLAVALP